MMILIKVAPPGCPGPILGQSSDYLPEALVNSEIYAQFRMGETLDVALSTVPADGRCNSGRDQVRSEQDEPVM
jgi:hypothetical protein